MAVPVHEGFSILEEGTQVTTATVNKPTGVVEGDLMGAWVAKDDNVSSAPEAGWTEIHDINIAGIHGAYSWKEAGASEGTTYDWTGDSEQWVIGIARITGHNATPIDVSAQDSSTGTSTPTCPDATTTVNDCLVYRCFSSDSDPIPTEDTGYPSGTTGVYVRDLAVVGGCAGGMAWEEQVTAGSVGTAAFSIGETQDSTMVTVAIAPVAAGGLSIPVAMNSYRQHHQSVV